MLYFPSRKINAEVAELAYASVSKTDFLTDMRVQLPPSAPLNDLASGPKSVELLFGLRPPAGK